MRRDRSRIRPDRQDDHALGEAARASASVSTVSRSSASAEPSRAATRLDRRRVVGVAGGRGLGEQQVPADQQRDQLHAVRVEAHPGRDRPGDRLAGDAVLGEAALADVVQQGGDHQHVGAGDLPDQRRRLDAGLHDVPVDGEPVDRRGVRQQPDPLPLGQDLVERAGLLERLPRAEQPAARGEQPDQQLGAPRPATASGSGAHSRASRAAVGGASTTSRSAASAAARSSSAGSSAGPGPPVEHDLARRPARRPRPPASATGGAADGARAGPARRRRGARSAGTGG